MITFYDHCTKYMLWVNENLKSCRNENKKYVVALSGHRNVAHVRPVRTTGHRFATLVVNKSYRRYAVCRTTSVMAYVRQTLVNSHAGRSLLPWRRLLTSISAVKKTLETVALVIALCCDDRGVKPLQSIQSCIALQGRDETRTAAAQLHLSNKAQWAIC